MLLDLHEVDDPMRLWARFSESTIATCNFIATPCPLKRNPSVYWHAWMLKVAKFDPECIFHNREKKKEYIAENKSNLNKRMLCLVQKLTHLPHD